MIVKRPSHLTGEAKAFWDRMAPIAKQLGTLTPADVPSFVCLCEAWERKCAIKGDDKSASIQFVCLNKQVREALKAHGLTPDSRKRMKIETNQPEANEGDCSNGMPF